MRPSISNYWIPVEIVRATDEVLFTLDRNFITDFRRMVGTLEDHPRTNYKARILSDQVAVSDAATLSETIARLKSMADEFGDDAVVTRLSLGDLVEAWEGRRTH